MPVPRDRSNDTDFRLLAQPFDDSILQVTAVQCEERARQRDIPLHLYSKQVAHDALHDVQDLVSVCQMRNTQERFPTLTPLTIAPLGILKLQRRARETPAAYLSHD